MSDLTIQQAAKKAIHLGKQLEAIVDVGKYLEETGNLATLRQEAEVAAETYIRRASEQLIVLEEAEARSQASTEQTVTKAAEAVAAEAKLKVVVEALEARKREHVLARQHLDEVRGQLKADIAVRDALLVEQKSLIAQNEQFSIQIVAHTTALNELRERLG